MNTSTWSSLAAFSLCVFASAPLLVTASQDETIPRPARLDPDYAGLVIPRNIAPLNFVIAENDVVRHEVKIIPATGSPLELRGTGSAVEVPIRPWQAMLRANAGQPLYVHVRVQSSSGVWSSFERSTNTVSSDSIDSHLVYRMLRPVYSLYGTIGIFQRNLSTFEEQPLMENSALNNGCLNCHTFLAHKPDLMALHIRNKEVGNPMLLVRSNAVTRVDKTCGYLSWHPSGRLLAFSVNKFALLFHTAGDTRDLYDAASDLGIYRVDSNLVVNPPAVARPDRLETWPSWAPDGRHLYFCSAPALKIERLKQIRYDLMRVSYDLEQDRWGKPETIVSARDTRLSAAQPRISPDGRFLLFCLAPNGNFPAYQAGSDLFLMDLGTRQFRPISELNSERSESWHSWSSDGRWIVFSSKRRDGLFTRPYFAHFSDGQFSKPFLLPQRDPRFYDSLLSIFNLPEFVTGPVTVPTADLVRGVFHPRHVLKPRTLSGDEGTPPHDPDEGRSSSNPP